MLCYVVWYLFSVWHVQLALLSASASDSSDSALLPPSILSLALLLTLSCLSIGQPASLLSQTQQHIFTQCKGIFHSSGCVWQWEVFEERVHKWRPEVSIGVCAPLMFSILFLRQDFTLNLELLIGQ